MVIHIVKAGESAYAIALKYGVSMQRLISDNELKNPGQLVIGQTLVILFPKQVHIVSQGETLFSIAKYYQTTVNQLYRNNPELNGVNTIKQGQTLVITYEGAKIRGMSVNAYAYPFIDKALLKKTLPYLTYLTPFTYGITEEGGLVDLDDEELIRTAREYGVAPLMHLSTLTEEGGFSNELASRVLNDMTVQNNLINNVMSNLKKKHYYGLDIDFEFVFATDAQAYVDFIKRMTDRANAEGYEVITALAPKTYSEQKGLLYEGHLYREIGDASNAVLLMTYEWGYTYGPPMAVAPISAVRAVVDYAITQINPKKIYLGIPNYGYDWPLPFVKGTSKAQSISNVAGVEIAEKYGAEILYDEAAQAPHFNYYTEEGIKHEVWFEDARSIKTKLALVPEYQLEGAGYWNLMRPFPQNWLVLNSLYNVKRVL